MSQGGVERKAGGQGRGREKRGEQDKGQGYPAMGELAAAHHSRTHLVDFGCASTAHHDLSDLSDLVRSGQTVVRYFSVQLLQPRGVQS